MVNRGFRINYIGLFFLLLLLPRRMATMPFVYLLPVLLFLLLLIKKDYHYSLNKGKVAGLAVLILVNGSVVFFNDSHFVNFFLGIATHGVLLLLCLDYEKTSNCRNQDVWGRYLILFCVCQLVLGFVQALSLGFPFRLPYRDFSEDFFEGSFGSGGNRLVANLFVVVVVYYFYRIKYAKKRYDYYMLFLFIVGIIATSSNMSLIGLLLCSLLIFLLNYKEKTKLLFFPVTFLSHKLKKKTLVFSLILIVIFVGFIQGGGFKYAKSFSGKFGESLLLEQFARYAAIYNTFTYLPEEAPYQPVVGIGLGNYSSWAQMVLSEDYFNRHISGKHSRGAFFSSENFLAYDNVLKYFSNNLFRAETESVIGQPFFSWQSLYAEIGLFGILVVLFLFYSKLLLLREVDSGDKEEKIFKSTLRFYLVFMIYNGFVDNYFEYVWLTMPLLIGLILLCKQKKQIKKGRFCDSSKDPLYLVGR